MSRLLDARRARPKRPYRPGPHLFMHKPRNPRERLMYTRAVATMKRWRRKPLTLARIRRPAFVTLATMHLRRPAHRLWARRVARLRVRVIPGMMK